MWCSVLCWMFHHIIAATFFLSSVSLANVKGMLKKKWHKWPFVVLDKLSLEALVMALLVSQWQHGRNEPQYKWQAPQLTSMRRRGWCKNSKRHYCWWWKDLNFHSSSWLTWETKMTLVQTYQTSSYSKTLSTLLVQKQYCIQSCASITALLRYKYKEKQVGSILCVKKMNKEL